MAPAPTAAFTSLADDYAALRASLRTFGHAERLLAAVAETLGDRACVENGAIYLRDADAIVPTPLLKLTRMQIVDAIPGLHVTFHASVLKQDGTVEPAKLLPPPAPPALDVGPRGDSATAGALRIAEGLAAIELSYDPRGILVGAGSSAEPVDAWAARIIALAPGDATPYRFHRARPDVTSAAEALAGALAGLRAHASDCVGPFVAIDAHESRAIASGASRDAAVNALADGLFRSRLRDRDGKVVTPSTLSAVTLTVPPRRALPAGFDRWQLAVGGVRGLVHLAVRDEVDGATLVGEDVFDRGFDLTTLSEDIERELREQREFMTTFHLARGDHEVVEMYRTMASVSQLAYDESGKLRFAGASLGEVVETASLDGDVVAGRVVRTSAVCWRDE